LIIFYSSSISYKHTIAISGLISASREFQDIL